MPHVYKITSPTKKIYIGSSIDIKERKRQYSTLHCKGQFRIYRSLKKYGWINHKFEIITECEKSEMLALEAYYGNLFDVLGKHGLNLKIPKHGEIYQTTSDETKEKLRKAATGIKRSYKTNIKMSESRKGFKHSDETKRKIRESLKGGKRSDETKRKMSKSQKTRFLKTKIIVS